MKRLAAILTLMLIALGASAQSSITNIIPPLWLPATGTFQGVAGVPGGIDQYSTNYTMFCNVKTSIPGTNIVAIGDGVADDTAALLFAVQHCPNNQYVYLPAGNYRITAPISRQNPSLFDGVIHPFSIIIRGAGMGQTTILNEGGAEGIWLMNNSGWVGITLATVPTRGTTNVTTSATFPSGGSALGQWMFVMHDNTTSGCYLPTNTDPQIFYVVYENSALQAVKITNISGNTVKFWPPLNEGYSNSWLKVIGDPPLRCGIEDLTIVQMVEGNSSNIRIAGGEECWLRNVESRQARKYHFAIEGCAACEIRGCYVHEPYPKKDTFNANGSSDYGICLGLGTCATLVEDNLALHVRHSFIMETGAGQNNVIAYNFGKNNIHEGFFGTDWQEDTDYHGGEQRWCLWEGNVVPLICADTVEGATKYCHYFRNFITRDGLPSVVANMYACNIQRGNWYDAVIANVYGYTAASAGTPVYLLGSWQVFTVGDTNTGQLDNHWDANAFNTPTGSNLLWQYIGEAKTLNKFWGNYNMLLAQYDYNTNGLLKFPSTFDFSQVPPSMLYTSKPSWYGTNTWPPFGGDVAGFTNLIPAQRRAATIPRFSESVSDGYVLTIATNHGTASAPWPTFFNGAWVYLAAAADSGYQFSSWSGYTVTNANSPFAYFVMPSSSVSLTANFAVGTNQQYSLSVVNGSGSGNYIAGATASISANTISGQTFTNWTGFGVANPLASSTTLAMPGSNVVVTANFTTNSQPIPPLTNPPSVTGAYYLFLR